MRALILRRVATAIPLIVVVTGVTFVLESLVPGNTARAIVGASGSPAAYQRLRAELGLNHPLWYQYWQYADQLVHGNLGTSVFTGEPVSTLLNQRLPVTLSLVLLATAFCAVVGVLLGVVSAVRGGAVGRAVEVLSLVGLALPGFWVAIILAAVFAVTLRIFPATGYVPPSDSVSRWLWALTLPVVALGLAGVASVAKQTRDSMKDTLAREYIRTLRASGIVLGLVFVSALSSTVFVEAVFVLPGLGSMAVTATSQHDIPVIEGIALYFTVLVVIVNVLLDIVYGTLNPKVRRS
jgi:peptide/nickel transport system permease protein